MAVAFFNAFLLLLAFARCSSLSAIARPSSRRHLFALASILADMAVLPQIVDDLRLKLDSTTINSDQTPSSSSGNASPAPPPPPPPPHSLATEASSLDGSTDRPPIPDESALSEGSAPFTTTNGCSSSEETFYEGSETFDSNIGGDFHGSYAVHGVYPIMDHNYAAPPFYDHSYMHAYAPYSFQGYQNPAGDYAFVSQPFPGSMSSEVQFSSQGNIAYVYGPPQVVQYTGYQQGYQQAPPHGGFQHAPSQAIQYSPYNSPLPAPGGVVMLDSQEPLPPSVMVSNGIASMTPFAAPMPTLTLPPGGMMMLDPDQSGVVVSNSCASINSVTGPMFSLGMPPRTPDLQGPMQQSLEGVSNLSAAAGSFTPALGFPVTGVPPYDNASVPATVTYSAYHEGNEAWDLSGNPKPSHSGFFYSPANSVQSYGSSTVVHLAPESGAFTKSRTPLLDVTTNFNSCDDGSMPHNVNVSVSIPAANRNMLLIRRGGEKNGFSNNSQRSRVEWAPVSKNVDCEKPELPAKELEPCTFSDEQQQYNRSDFITQYEDAKHFIIKSFSEANVRQSVKHKVWSSTHHGNRKLDQAYEDAQNRAKGKPNGCPVFLFFSVNGSGQFCGVAEMVGRVDYTKTMDCWDRERWSGSFPVKWHIIKNVPNFQLHGIILQDNENKPVTNSRDTQEVNFQQGLQMLNIFKKYYARSWILDDCNIYQSYQKITQESPKIYQKVYQVAAKTESEKTTSTDVGEEVSENVS